MPQLQCRPLQNASSRYSVTRRTDERQICKNTSDTPQGVQEDTSTQNRCHAHLSPRRQLRSRAFHHRVEPATLEEQKQGTQLRNRRRNERKKKNRLSRSRPSLPPEKRGELKRGTRRCRWKKDRAIRQHRNARASERAYMPRASTQTRQLASPQLPGTLPVKAIA